MEHLREKFLNVYANVPLTLRDEVVLVYKDQPMSWKVVYFEVKTNTESSKEILANLQKLGII